MKKFLTGKWADCDKNGNLVVSNTHLKHGMYNSDGTGSPLVVKNKFGADLIHFDAKKGVGMHTHIGAHILFVIAGTGYVDYYDKAFDLYPGLVYFVPSKVPHAIRAKTDLTLIAVGNDHRSVDSPERLETISSGI